jgi:hypothetical protein
MDIEKIIDQLRAERDRLEGIIVALERLHGNAGTTATPKRRGRKFMDKQGRRDVSERMKRYWASRRTASAGSGEEKLAGGASASSDSGEKPEREDSTDSAHFIAA